jgi:hypothetical protein
MKSMTYGVLPTEDEFRAAYDATELRDGLFHFGNDKRLGNCALNCTELWNEVCKAHTEYEQGPAEQTDDDSDNEESLKAADETGDWLSRVLGCFGFEWI